VHDEGPHAVGCASIVATGRGGPIGADGAAAGAASYFITI
jgi:hypothetical protein